MIKKVLFSLLCLCYFSGISQDAMADCSGSMASSCAGSVARSTPVRNAINRKPVRSILQKITARTSSSCSGSSVQSSCAGSVQVQVQTSCTDSTQLMERKVPQPVEPQASVPVTKATHLVSHQFFSDDYNRAYQSASYRAANGIKGHVNGELVSGRASSSGVGFATNNPNPTTCLGVPGRTNATCAVVRGPDGWYSTCVK